MLPFFRLHIHTRIIMEGVRKNHISCDESPDSKNRLVQNESQKG